MFARLCRWLRRRAATTLGERGEAVAARYLRRKGYRIVARRERDALGELDLVAVDRRVIVFVEVKTRRSHRRGHPADAVDAHKQSRLTRAALAFLKRHQLLEHAARFDVISVTWPPHSRRPVVEHFCNAFEPAGRGQFFS
jgi:putative endonuclease